MATVTMDISELKLMEENKALLEKALEREEQLKESIELILEEKEKAIEDKLKAYEEAKMSVAYIKRITRKEYRLQTYHTDDKYYLRLYRECFRQDNNPDTISIFINKLFNTYSSTTFTENHEDEVEYKGFNEVRSEIKKELELNLSKETKDKIDNYNELSNDYNRIDEYNKLLVNDNKTLQEDFDKMKNEYEKTKITYQATIDELVNKISLISKIERRVNERGLFNKNTILDDILIYINQLNIK